MANAIQLIISKSLPNYKGFNRRLAFLRQKRGLLENHASGIKNREKVSKTITKTGSCAL
jgi:hypothetical protein